MWKCCTKNNRPIRRFNSISRGTLEKAEGELKNTYT